MKRKNVMCATRIVTGSTAGPSTEYDSDPRCKSYKTGLYYTRNCTIILDFDNRCDGDDKASNQQENQANLPPIKNYDNVPNYPNNGYTNKIYNDNTKTVAESTTSYRLPDNKYYNSYWNKSKNLDGSREPSHASYCQNDHPYDYQTDNPYNYQNDNPYDHQNDDPYDCQTDNPYDYQTDPPYDYQTDPPYDYQTDHPYDYQTDNPYDYQTDNLYDCQTDNPKTDRPKSPKQEKTLELETYGNAVLYADLRLNPASDTRPVNKTEETYAEIVGVLRPDHLYKA
uniref:Uncharacterized protein n=1 Tax=Heliothis virescens TaxID=7102 RepID=A0A2A4K2I9_HELVI